MTDQQHSTDHGPAIKAILAVFALLCVFTATSFFVNEFERSGHISKQSALAIIMGVAVVKAICVGLIFMHLKMDWSKVYFIIIPVAIMGVMMTIVLSIDQMLVWNHAWSSYFPTDLQPGFPPKP